MHHHNDDSTVPKNAHAALMGRGIGRRLIQTDRTSLLALGGAAFNHETFFPQPGTELIRNNTGALLGLTFNIFRFKTLNFSSGCVPVLESERTGPFSLHFTVQFADRAGAEFYLQPPALGES